MKKLLATWVIASLMIIGCTGAVRHRAVVIPDLGPGLSHHRDKGIEAAHLALGYYDCGGYEKSAELFKEAAGHFERGGEGEKMQNALLAAAKVSLKAGDRDEFSRLMERVKGLQGRYSMPHDDVRILVDLADRMKNRPLTYPVPANLKGVLAP